MKLTRKAFFELLPKTKSLKPKVNSRNYIRFEGGMCPLTAVNYIQTGKKLTANQWLEVFSWNDPKWAESIIDAADSKKYEPKLRAKMLAVLGLA